MPDISGDLSFKFNYVKNGEVIRAFFKKKGSATASALTLDEEAIPYAAIANTAVRDNFVILAFFPNITLPDKLRKQLAGEDVLVIKPQPVSALELKRFIDRNCSKAEVERRHHELLAADKGDLFRVELCPECGAAIDLSELDTTPLVYCRFCETIIDAKRKVITSGSKYRICDECGMFDRVKGYTEFYFYFLVYLIGFSHNRRHICANCTSTIFWKMLFVNTLFLLGLPHTIALKVKSMTGHDPELKALALANAWSLKGRYPEADPLFAELLRAYPGHPGLHMNQGLGHLRGNDVEGAAGCFEQALTSCANYLPVLEIMTQIIAMSENAAVTEEEG